MYMYVRIWVGGLVGRLLGCIGMICKVRFFAMCMKGKAERCGLVSVSVTHVLTNSFFVSY